MVQHFQTEQWVPFPIDRVFLFFANPQNLPRIMPSSMAMRIESMHLTRPSPPDNGVQVTNLFDLAGVGSEIVTSFRVVPFLPFRANWTSVIVEFAWNNHFADIQKKGMFKKFHHKHELIAQEREGKKGTIVRDRVEYDVGFGLVGAVVQRLFVGRQLNQMFVERQRVLEDLLCC